MRPKIQCDRYYTKFLALFELNRARLDIKDMCSPFLNHFLPFSTGSYRYDSVLKYKKLSVLISFTTIFNYFLYSLIAKM
jgi:hypothetical protein